MRDAQFRVTRTVNVAGALTVHYRVSETGAMVASGEEGAQSVAFGDGDTAQVVTVPTVEDTGPRGGQHGDADAGRRMRPTSWGPTTRRT